MTPELFAVLIAPGEHGRVVSGGGHPATGGGHLVSGGGWVAEVHGSRGPVHLRTPAGAYPLHVETPSDLGSSVRLLAGGWIRTVPLPGGGALEEEGLLADGPGAIGIRWGILGPGGGAREAVENPSAPIRLLTTGERVLWEGEVGRQPVTVVLGEGDPSAGPDPEQSASIRRFYRSFPARAQQRASRFRTEEEGAGPVRLAWTPTAGPAIPGLEEARRILDAALPDPRNPALALGVGARPSTAPDAPRTPKPVRRREGSRILVAGGSTPGDAPGHDPSVEAGIHAEVGIAFLLLGWWEAAGIQLATLADRPDAHPHGFLHLASLWAGWTGRPERLLHHEVALQDAAAALRPGPLPVGGAAWPNAARLVHDLANAIEPTGRTDWRKGLLARSALLSPSASRLSLPSIQAYPGLHDPSLAPRRTRVAARFVRSWIAGHLGASAEAGHGRLRLAPGFGDEHPGAHPPLPPLGTLELRALRVGDARVTFHCRRRGGRFTFRVTQTQGRVPLQFVFEPWLPLRRVDMARLGEERAELDVHPERGGVRVRVQFPLDPERRLTIDGEA